MILNIATKGLSVGAKIILKQLKTLIKKSSKTKKDREKITKLKKELKADNTVKVKQSKLQSQKYKSGGRDMGNKPTKQDKGDLKQGERYVPSNPNKKGKLDIDDAYYNKVGKLVDTISDKDMKKLMKLKTNKEVSKEVMKRTKGMYTGGTLTKKKPIKKVVKKKK